MEEMNTFQSIKGWLSQYIIMCEILWYKLGLRAYRPTEKGARSMGSPTEEKALYCSKIYPRF